MACSGMHEALNSLDLGGYTYNPSTEQVLGDQVQGHPLLDIEAKTNLGYLRQRQKLKLKRLRGKCWSWWSMFLTPVLESL